MSVVELALVGLIEEAILPGEARTFGPPAVTRATIAQLACAQQVVAVTIASAVELPGYVQGRWATACEVTEAGETLTLRGDGRVRIVTAHGSDGAFRACVEPSQPDCSVPLADVARAAHTLAAALEAGALPLDARGATDVASAVAALARALAGHDEPLKKLVAAPLPDAVLALAETMAARTQGERAACSLEAMTRELIGKPEVTSQVRQKLWSQMVEIAKRLDIYDSVEPDSGDDVARLQRRLSQAGLPKYARAVAKRELRLLRTMKADHHDYSHFVAHLDLIARLPWHPDPALPTNLDAVAAALDREHSGLDKPKQRILEYLAVRGLGGSGGAMIICLVGPPGVGKTSIARAIAEALGRKFVRVPLGGVHDECEIRGFRRSFVAASSGRILTGIAHAGSASPVMLLDEIDKLGTDQTRSPAGALHEVLDPEQNSQFHDNYLEIPYDLSHVLFICTANDANLLPATLLDRLELIELEGYSFDEKLTIARRHLLPKAARESGLEGAVAIDDEALTAVISGYTREAGVRQLGRALAALCRRRALILFRQGGSRDSRAASAWQEALGPLGCADVREALGSPRHHGDLPIDLLPAGVVAGLAVGAHGGDVLFIEIGAMVGEGGLRMTGRLGDVMRESAETAFAHLRMDPERYGVAPSALERAFHVHVPEGAVPKEGPSAGLALLIAFVSAARNLPVRAGVAFTGELTLTGRVLAVGGVRSKLAAAERAGMTTVVIPRSCQHDVPDHSLARVVLVDSARQAVSVAFGAAPVSPNVEEAARACPKETSAGIG